MDASQPEYETRRAFSGNQMVERQRLYTTSRSIADAF
jgi:hypothetical protein